MYYPGDVWYLPPELRPGGDPKQRRQVLLTHCEGEDDVGTFAFATTRPTEMVFGGAAFRFDPRGRRGVGFDRITYITPCRLTSSPRTDWLVKSGRIGGEMADVRTELRKALGIGRGTSAPGFRGSLAELRPAIAEELGVRYGLIVSESGYSLQKRYQILVPLLDGEEFIPEEGEPFLTNLPWASAVLGSTAVLFAIRSIQSVFHPEELTRVTEIRVDTSTMSKIDTALVRLFGLDR